MLKTDTRELVSRLGAAEKAALRLLVDLPNQTLDETAARLFSLYPWTGVILFKKNVAEAGQVRRLIGDLQAANAERFPEYPLFVSVDQEGGSVSPLESCLTPSPGNMALTATGDDEAVYAMARLNGRELRGLGFNVNFAPVVDVNINPENPIIGIRSFGADPETVGRLGARAARGYQDEGIMATAKHFPGHGDTAKDSHLDLPVVAADPGRLAEVELRPFRMAAEAGVWGMMTAHVIYPALDRKPATLSEKILTGILRKEMKFGGIIFTDSFAMAAIKEHFDLEEAIRDSILAGADVLLALGDDTSQLETLQILKDLIEKEKLPRACVDEPLHRILSFRRKLGRFHPPEPLPIEPDFPRTLHEKCVTIVRRRIDPPLPEEAKIFLTPEASRHADVFLKRFGRAGFVPWPWPERPRDPSWLFMAERRLLPPEVGARLREWRFPFRCVVSFGNPYHLSATPEAELHVATYHFNALFVDAARAVIVEGKPAAGHLPVTIPGL